VWGWPMLGLRSEVVQAMPVSRSRGRGSATRRVQRSARSALLLTTLALLASPAAADIRGRVFEDVNYGGGAGRSFGASLGVGRDGAWVELYDSAGLYVESTTTAADGTYAFTGKPNGNYTVRVVNSSVTSSRTGYFAGLLPVQTFRTEASTLGFVTPVPDYVGGQNPAVADAADGGSGSGATVMDTTTGPFTAGITGWAQSITPVTLGAADIAGVDFGFNFDTIVNVNDSGQGSLRQFLLNSNALGGEGALAQSGFRMNLLEAVEALPAARETSLFMISDGAAHPGLRAG